MESLQFFEGSYSKKTGQITGKFKTEDLDGKVLAEQNLTLKVCLLVLCNLIVVVWRIDSTAKRQTRHQFLCFLLVAVTLPTGAWLHN